MNKKILVLVHPFIIGQYICVYEGEMCIEKVVADFDSAPEKIFEVAAKYGVNVIDLKGKKFFASKIKDNIENHTKYSKNKLEINII
jgi:hypothetical protein